MSSAASLVPPVVDDARLRYALRQELLRLARVEDQAASEEAARVAYWEPCPEIVLGHRAAARALRADADRFLDA